MESLEYRSRFDELEKVCITGKVCIAREGLKNWSRGLKNWRRFEELEEV